ncbi:hypothetical protein DENSPDRAFT_842420 [Dentipellis sp. KUC8613]|nr:hypothetical protein DENSPDRAFT_842420 [Dentipellis sp. KUC8613]
MRALRRTSLSPRPRISRTPAVADSATASSLLQAILPPLEARCPGNIAPPVRLPGTLRCAWCAVCRVGRCRL